MKRKFHDFLTLLASTEKLLTRAGFELAHSGIIFVHGSACEVDDDNNNNNNNFFLIIIIYYSMHTF